MGESIEFKDHFSGHAAGYRAARPTYPTAFIDALIAEVAGRSLCWDVGCGNGQASVLLAERFTKVIATDPSATQIAEAVPGHNIDYRVEPAESSTLPDHGVDFISVAQAYHWFDHHRFAKEVYRVAKPGAVIAAYGYRQTRISKDVDDIVATLYAGTLGADWPPERAFVDAGLITLPFPYTPMPVGDHKLVMHWTADQFIDYLRSWSAAERYRKRTGADAVAAIAADLRAAFGDTTRNVEFDLFARVGRVDR